MRGCMPAVIWWQLGCHHYLVVPSTEHSQERSSCVNLYFIFLLSFKTHVSLWSFDDDYSFLLQSS